MKKSPGKGIRWRIYRQKGAIMAIYRYYVPFNSDGLLAVPSDAVLDSICCMFNYKGTPIKAVLELSKQLTKEELIKYKLISPNNNFSMATEVLSDFNHYKEEFLIRKKEYDILREDIRKKAADAINRMRTDLVTLRDKLFFEFKLYGCDIEDISASIELSNKRKLGFVLSKNNVIVHITDPRGKEVYADLSDTTFSNLFLKRQITLTATEWDRGKCQLTHGIRNSLKSQAKYYFKSKYAELEEKETILRQTHKEALA